MFVRVNQQRNKDGSVRQYLQLIEAVRVGGRLKFRGRPGLVGNNLAVQVTSVGREGEDQR